MKENNKDNLKKDIEDMKLKLAEMEKHLEEGSKGSGWYGAYGKGEFYYIDADGGSYSKHGVASDISGSNKFTTREKAEEINFKQTLWRMLQRFADEHDDGGGDVIQIYYSLGSELLKTSSQKYSPEFGAVSFSSREVANQAIDAFKTELTKYFTI